MKYIKILVFYCLLNIEFILSAQIIQDTDTTEDDYVIIDANQNSNLDLPYEPKMSTPSNIKINNVNELALNYAANLAHHITQHLQDDTTSIFPYYNNIFYSILQSINNNDELENIVNHTRLIFDHMNFFPNSDESNIQQTDDSQDLTHKNILLLIALTPREERNEFIENIQQIWTQMNKNFQFSLLPIPENEHCRYITISSNLIFSGNLTESPQYRVRLNHYKYRLSKALFSVPASKREKFLHDTYADWTHISYIELRVINCETRAQKTSEK